MSHGNICAGSYESEYPIRGSSVRKHQIRCSSRGMHNENLVKMDLLRQHHTASLHIKLFIELRLLYWEKYASLLNDSNCAKIS